jgi:serine/threonine protein kinase
VEDKYKIKKIVGYGATSVVYKAYVQSPEHSQGSPNDLVGANPGSGNKKKEYVAIKKVKNVFENEIYAHRILRELRLLRLLRGHKNIVQLRTIMRPT